MFGIGWDIYFVIAWHIWVFEAATWYGHWYIGDGVLVAVIGIA